MASLVFPRSSKKGASLQWYEDDGERRTLYLGRCPKRWAENFARHFERLVEHVRFQEPLDRKTVAWLTELDGKWKTKLAAKGLVAAEAVSTLSDLIDYCRERASKGNVASTTIDKLNIAAANLFAYFDPSQSIHAITLGDAEEYARWLRIHGRRDGQDRELSATTACKQLKTVNGFFRVAVAKEFCQRNPFAGIAGEVNAPDAQQYVSTEVVNAVLEHCSPPLATRVVLARYAGLRHPTEVEALELEWINLPQGRLLAFSQKNQRYEHKRWREIPIDPLLLPHLEDAIERAPIGERHVCWEKRGLTGTSWRNALHRACRRAAVTPWKSLWHSLRGSRAVDLLDAGVPEHVVCVWQNTGPRALQKHYLRPTADHYSIINGVAPVATKQAEQRVGERLAVSVAMVQRGRLEAS